MNLEKIVEWDSVVENLSYRLPYWCSFKRLFRLLSVFFCLSTTVKAMYGRNDLSKTVLHTYFILSNGRCLQKRWIDFLARSTYVPKLLAVVCKGRSARWLNEIQKDLTSTGLSHITTNTLLTSTCTKCYCYMECVPEGFRSSLLFSGRSPCSFA